MPDEEYRDFLKPAAFGDGMPMVLVLDDPGQDAPWYWSDPSGEYEGAPSPSWFVYVTVRDTGAEYTLACNAKIAKAIARMENEHGVLAKGTVFTLEKTIKGRAHNWTAMLVDQGIGEQASRPPVDPATVRFVKPGGDGDTGQQPTGTQGAQAPVGGTPAANGATKPNSGYVSLRDVYRAPWSKEQALGLWQMASKASRLAIADLLEAAADSMDKVNERRGEEEKEVELHVGDVMGAWQGALSTFIIHGQRAMDPLAFGDDRPIPDSVIDKYYQQLTEKVAMEANLDRASADAVIARVFLEARGEKKFGQVLADAVNNFNTFRSSVVAEMSDRGLLPDDDTPTEPEGPPPVDDSQIPFALLLPLVLIGWLM